MKQSLTFAEADYRYNVIEKAQTATFDWIFGNQVSFMKWILSSEKVYWIRGKPGSGKSTLMKFLRDHHDFQQAIAHDRFDMPQVVLWYFFNERGTHLQKTLEGLLRTILCSLVKQSSLFATLVADVYCAKPTEQRGMWSIDELNEAFAAIVRQQQTDMKLLLFLDALDEYQGFPEIICDWIQRLINVAETGGGRTRVRICFSSRPWDSFLRAFESSPGFTLHLHTMQDMKYYARQRLADTVTKQPVATFSKVVLGSPSLIEQIVEFTVQRAEGVFLWVAFAIDEVTATLDTPDAQSLALIVDRLPAQLEDFYWRTVKRIAEGSRWQALVMLELVLRNIDLTYAEDLFFASSCANGSTFNECRQLIKNAQAQQLTELETSRTMLNLCNGLLEYVMPSTDDDRSKVGYVQFTHRTVKDFVGSPGFVQVILGKEQATRSMNGYTFWLKYYLARASSTWRTDSQCLWFAHMDEKSNGRPLGGFFDSVPAAFFEAGDDLRFEFAFGYSSAFIFGVVADLRLYVYDIIVTARQKAQIAKLRDQHPHHALALAAVHRQGYFIGLPEAAWDRSSMSAMLLENGFDICEKADGMNPFEILFSRSWEGTNTFQTSDRSDRSSEVVSIVKVLIEKGAQNPDSRLGRYRDMSKTGGKSLPEISRTSSALHLASNRTMLQTLLDCGANPNVLDVKGNTPLDVFVGTEGTFFQKGIYRMTPRDLSEACELVRILLDHGGLLTERGQKVLPQFLAVILDSADYEYLAQRLSEIPLLETESATKIPAEKLSSQTRPKSHKGREAKLTDLRAEDSNSRDGETADVERTRSSHTVSTMKAKFKALVRRPRRS